MMVRERRVLALVGREIFVRLPCPSSYGVKKGINGNIGRPSDVIYPIRTNADGTRRRSSVWSSITTPTGTSPEGKKGGFWGMFRRGSVNEEVVKDDGEVDAVVCE